MPEEVKDTIQQIAVDGIKRAQGDQGSMETHSIQDLIAADNHLAKKAAAANPARQLKRVIFKLPGAV